LGQINLRLPFYFSAGLALINWLYGYFILPESLPKALRTERLNWRRAIPAAGAIGFLRSKGTLFGLASVYFLFQLAHNVFPSTFVLYVGYRFGWGPRDAGLTMVATGLVSVATQTLLVGRVVKAIGERGALLVGLSSATLAFLCYGLAANGAVFLVTGLAAGALSGLIGPGIQGLMSRRVGPSEQGQLQGVNSAMAGVCAIIGPMIYLSALAFSARHAQTLPLPGLPILIAAVLSGTAVLIAIGQARPLPDASPAAEGLAA
jgi:DHA1 family tetracycline resistance protein-like MFS transporter